MSMREDDANGEQAEILLEADRAVYRRWPSDDDIDARERARTGAQRVIRGDATLEEITEAWNAQRAGEREAMDLLTGAIIATAVTETERDITRRTGLNRGTVRKALGKDPRQPAHEPIGEPKP